jgi:hypothetical protein
MRRRETVDPAMDRDLAALDAALGGAAAPDVDAELAALVRDVRSAAPRFDGPARAELDGRVADGFPSATPQPQPRRRLRPARPRLSARALVPVAGAVAAALVGVVAVVGSGGNPAGSGGGGSSALEQARPADGGGAGSAGSAPSIASPSAATVPSSAPQKAADPVVPGVATIAPSVPPAPSPGRRVERTVDLSLRTSTGRFDAVTDGVVRATQRAGGFVADSQVHRTGTRGTATFTLRIPAARLGSAVAALSRLAHVRSIEQASDDLTGATDATAARLQDARTRRRALVAALATASGARAARLRARLAGARARERRLASALRVLQRRTSYATVDVTVTAARRSAASTASSDSRFTPAAAWRDARRGLEIAAGVAIIALTLGLPLALAGALVGVAANGMRRRRREAALDAA